MYCLKIILGKDYVEYISALESCKLETLESRRDKLSLSFAKKCIKSSKHRHLFPAPVHPHENKLRHQEQYYVNYTRTEKNILNLQFYLFRDCLTNNLLVLFLFVNDKSLFIYLFIYLKKWLSKILGPMIKSWCLC